MRRFSILILALSLVTGLSACDDDSSDGGARLELYARALVPTKRAIDGIELERARFVLREIELETHDEGASREDDSVDDDSGEEFEFEAGPVMLELALDGSMNEILVARVPAGIYDEFECDVHRLDDDDARDLAVFDDPEFADFVAGDRYSVIIEGTVTGDGGAVPFTFRSRLDATQERELVPPLVIEAADTEASLTFVVDTTMWFDDGQGGSLDPADPANRDRIDENIEASIDVFEDDDQDGEKDD